MEETIEQIDSFDIGEKELKFSPKSAKKIDQLKNIIYRLEGLYNRLDNTPECK